jgi:protein O-mannosyl-transferase
LNRDWWIYAALLLAILAAYGQVYDFQFVNYDDPDYVTENLHVRDGLTASGVEWAFKSTEYANWLPLSWLSHMLDVELYGLESGRHHLTSVAIHALTTLLLFALLRKITGDRWPSAFVAFVFGLHPLHVESVAWIAERKDVLSGFFFIATLWAYVLWVERRSAIRYAAIVVLFACGIMAKPMVVTLPFVALLLDVWPLRRFSKKTVIEKIPLFAMSAASAVMTYIAQQRGGAVNTLAEIPFTLRLENAAASYLTYAIQFFFPTPLAVFYPFPHAIPARHLFFAVVLLAVVTLAAVRSLPVRIGWLWYLGTLVPVIGLVKIGLQSHADRYTYIPLIGLSIAFAWGVQSFAKQHHWVVIPIAIWACATCAGTFFQVATWRDSTTLFEHALAVTDGNYVAQNNLGVALRCRSTPRRRPM